MTPLELEVGVVRDQTWVFRAVFRPPAMISVGSSPSAVLPLPDSDLPPYHELIRLRPDGGALFFGPGMAVELRLKEGLRRDEDLLRDGLAEITGNGWRVPLGLGSKGAFRVRDVSVLFKVRAQSTATLKAVRVGDPCGDCGATLECAVVGFGALTRCSVCGALNEVQAETSSADSQATAFAPVVRPGHDADLPTFDAISAFDAEQAERALKAEMGAAVNPHGIDETAPTTELPRFQPMGTKPLKGADLPTFDAISVIRDEGLSTQAAIHAMRGGSEEEPPMMATEPIIQARTFEDGEPPISLSAPLRGPGSIVELSVEEEMAFFGADDDVTIDLQRSFTSLPIMKTESVESLGPGATRPGPTRPMPATPPAASPPPAPTPEPPATPPGPTRLTPAYQAPPELPEPPPVVPTADAPRRIDETWDDEGSDDDDFLMGRVEVPDADDGTNRWLLIIGGVCGLAGLALIVWTLLQG